MAIKSTSPDESLPARDWYAYMPILATALVSVLVAHVLRLTYQVPFLPIFTGLWLTQFALIKLFDLEDFVSKFGQYDLFAVKVRSYAFFFPFLQLMLGLLYLGDFFLPITSGLLILLATFNLIGIFRQVKNDAVFKGVYFSGLSRTPLRDAAIIENALMILMALGYFLAYHIFWGVPINPVA